MNVILSPHGAELLRAAHDRQPELSPAEILEAALAEHFSRDRIPAPRTPRSKEAIRAWLDELAALSDNIPAMAGETQFPITFTAQWFFKPFDEAPCTHRCGKANDIG